jgi:hypothetical protein
MTKRIVCACGVILLTGSAAFAQALQPPNGRVFVNGSIGAQFSPARHETTAFSFSLYDEPATVNVERSVKGGLLGDITAGGRVLGKLGVAGSIFYRSAPGDGAVTSSIPDPVFFDRPRSVNATLVDMTHTELWSAVQGTYFMKLDDHMDLLLMVGPTVVSVKHQVADTATVTEGVSSATVTVGTTDLSKLVWGYTVAADLRYMIRKNLGFGAFVRYSGATANMNDAVRLKLGGFQVGAGVRLAIF